MFYISVCSNYPTEGVAYQLVEKDTQKLLSIIETPGNGVILKIADLNASYKQKFIFTFGVDDQVEIKIQGEKSLPIL